MSLEATLMKHQRVICTAVLLLLLATTIPAFAQKGEEEEGGGKPAAAQHEQKAQPKQHAQKAEPKEHAQKAAPKEHAQKAEPNQRAQKTQSQTRAQQSRSNGSQQTRTVASNRGGGGGQYGRISNVNYNAHFGENHSFHMGRPEMVGGYNRFHYGGYWFGFNEGWPMGWEYGDNCYVVFLDGGYYMYDLRHPGLHITLSIF